ncbi:MAG: LD-carboxypeptidase [Anaerolineales bacterium]|nr:LD-carboxypeptidase [Anaerolineales bacterium]
MYPRKLSPGDEIRVVAPSISFGFINAETRAIAKKRFSELGLRVSYGAHCEERDASDSSSIDSRIADLHDAFADPQVAAVLSAIGGYNCNQLLRRLDFELVRAHPKILCGYSDITVLGASIYAKTGLVTYSGPHFSTFGMEKGLEYTIENFRRCLMQSEPFDVAPSEAWSDDAWFQDQLNRTFIPNPGFQIIHEGHAEGVLLGGNLCTLNLLQGTEYMPPLAGSILLVEDESESKPGNFDRDLQSLIHQPGFEHVRGLVIGRFQKQSGMTAEIITGIVESKTELKKIPVIANADFGHTTPHFTFPVGGQGALTVEKGAVRFRILEH